VTDKDLFTGIVFTTNDMEKIAGLVDDLDLLTQEFGTPGEYAETFDALLDFLKGKVEEARIKTWKGRARGTE
jgi:RNAse (barnase) inhibitor barstar